MGASSEGLRGRVRRLNDDQLKVLVTKWAEWFDPENEEPDLYRDAAQEAKAQGREAMVELILKGDPVYAEGGLNDFLYANNVR